MKKQKPLIQLTVAISLALMATGAIAATGDSNVTRATLDNGLRVVIVRNTLAPVVTTQMNYLVGSDETPKGFPGTAHATEHMMFQGSPRLTKNQLSAITANMGADANAHTHESVTQYHLTIPKQDLDVALRVQSIRMRGVNMGPAAWAKERGAIEQEVSGDMSNPTFKFITQMRAEMFAGTPYAHTGLGTRASFNKTTAAALKTFHEKWYAPNNAILVIVGDVDPAATLAQVNTDFGSIARKTLPARPGFNFMPMKARTIHLPTDSSKGYVYIAYRSPGLTSKNYATALVLSQAMGSERAALAGMRYDGTALEGGFQSEFLPMAGIDYAIGEFTRGDNPQPVLKRMRAIVAAASKGVDPALVEAAKRNAIAALEFKKNSVSGLAKTWSQALAFQGLSSPDAIKQAIEAVTPAQINALAKATFDPDHALTAILTPQSSSKPVSSKGFGGVESFSSSPSKPVTLPDWAAKAFAKLTLPKSALHPTSYTLPNGLHLIVQPESISDTVELYGHLQTNKGLQMPKGEEGVSLMLNHLFSYGTTSMNRSQYQQALDGISATASAGYRFSLSVPSAHFAQGLKLLADNELHPALPAKAFAVSRRQLAGVVAGTLQSPGFLANMDMQKALLPAGDPALRIPIPNQVKALTLNQVKQYYAKAFRPDLTTIVIVGKVDPAQAKDAVEQAFGQWHASGPKPAVNYPAVPLNKLAHVHVPDSSGSQDSVKMAQIIKVSRNDPARFALKLGNEVLGGSFASRSRFYHDLRGKSGLAYEVDSGFNFGKYRSNYIIYFGSDPDKVSPARAIVIRDLKQMQTTLISPSDLKKAKGILLRQIPLGESSFDAIGKRLLGFAVEGKPLNQATIAGQHYLQMTAPEVQHAYATYVRPDDFVTVVKGPAPKG